jgi:hypothetical protein
MRTAASGTSKIEGQISSASSSKNNKSGYLFCSQSLYLSRVSRIIHLKDGFFSVLMALAFLFWRGFIVNTADQGEHLPLVYKLLQPDLYPKDFYVQAASDIFTIRYYYVHLLGFLGKFISMETLCFGLNVLCLSAAVWAWIKLARYFGAGRVGGFLAPFFIFFLFYGWTVGGNAIQYPLLISSTFAKALAPWALYAALRSRWLLAGVLLGLAGLFQVLVGLQLALVIGALLLLGRQWKAFGQFSASFAVLIAPMLLPILYRQFFVDTPVANGEMNSALYYEILFKWRNPHHYLPSLFSIGSYVKLAVLLAAGLWSVRRISRREDFQKLAAFGGMVLVGLLIYTVSLEWLGIHAIGKLQFFKTTIWLQAFSAMAISIWIEQLLRKFADVRGVQAIALALPVLWILQSHVRHDTPLSFDHRTDEQKELTDLHRWIADSTPVDALFATYATNESFICEAKRSQYVAWNPIVHEPWFLLQWHERFSELYGNPFLESDYKGTLQRADANFEGIDWKAFGCTHLLIGSDVKVESSHQVLKEGEIFKVLTFN